MGAFGAVVARRFDEAGYDTHVTLHGHPKRRGWGPGSRMPSTWQTSTPERSPRPCRVHALALAQELSRCASHQLPGVTSRR
jgi:hypothetical protein